MPSEPLEQAIKVLLAETEAAIANRDWETAASLVDAALKLDPENVDALSFRLGPIYEIHLRKLEIAKIKLAELERSVDVSTDAGLRNRQKRSIWKYEVGLLGVYSIIAFFFAGTYAVDFFFRYFRFPEWFYQLPISHILDAGIVFIVGGTFGYLLVNWIRIKLDGTGLDM